MAYLFVQLRLAPADEAARATEFWECVKHLLEGGDPALLPLRLLPRENTLYTVKAILSGAPVQIGDAV